MHPQMVNMAGIGGQLAPDGGQHNPVYTIEHKPVQKGKPMQNEYVERFNRTYREDVLDLHIFENIDQVREKTEEFLDDCLFRGN